MHSFVGDYLLLSFLSSFGVLLFVTAHSRLIGLYLMGRGLAQVTGALLAIGAFYWFFTSEPRNVPDTLAGLDGNQQTLLFAAGAASALGALLLLSSLRNWPLASRRPLHGLDALRQNNYLRLISAEVSFRWKYWSKQTKKRSSG
ncbi:MAG: hypothetical protein HY533_01030 [Chloroflexi bacterium]|nr:hypothetical protein [Chloroflexota bacterium]